MRVGKKRGRKSIGECRWESQCRESVVSIGIGKRKGKGKGKENVGGGQFYQFDELGSLAVKEILLLDRSS